MKRTIGVIVTFILALSGIVSAQDYTIGRDDLGSRPADYHPWKWAIRLGGNLSAATDGDYDNADPGVGFEGDIRCALSEKFALRGTVSRSGARNFSVSESFITDFDILYYKITSTATRYVLGVQFGSVRYKPGRNSHISGALYSQIGFLAESYRTRYRFHYYSPDRTVSNEERRTNYKLINAIGGELTRYLSDNLALCGGVEFDAVFLGGRHGKSIEIARIWDAKFGVLVMF